MAIFLSLSFPPINTHKPQFIHPSHIIFLVSKEVKRKSYWHSNIQMPPQKTPKTSSTRKCYPNFNTKVKDLSQPNQVNHTTWSSLVQLNYTVRILAGKPFQKLHHSGYQGTNTGTLCLMRRVLPGLLLQDVQICAHQLCGFFLTQQHSWRNHRHRRPH